MLPTEATQASLYDSLTIADVSVEACPIVAAEASIAMAFIFVLLYTLG